MRRLMLAGVTIAVLATGCKGNVNLAGSSPTESGAPSTATPAPSAPSSNPVTSPPSAPAHVEPSSSHTAHSGSAPTPACYSMGLHASLDGYDAGAGQRYVRLVLTNLTEHPCTISGWPALELMASGNTALGADTTRSGSSSTVVIPASGYAHSQLHWTVVPADDETGNPCEPTPAMLQVTAPGETTPLFTSWNGGAVCQHFAISETALTAGSGA